MNRPNASEIARDIQGLEGWTDATLLGVVLDYIDSQCSNDAFTDYLEERRRTS
jgi:hypothetical protein